MDMRGLPNLRKQAQYQIIVRKNWIVERKRLTQKKKKIKWRKKKKYKLN